MADTMHLIARTLHIGFAALWIGHLGVLAWVTIPSAQGKRGRAADLEPVLRRLRPLLLFGPLAFLAGSWLVTASGHSWGVLASTGWGQAILGGIVVALVMMGIEHGVLMPAMRNAERASGRERASLLSRARLSANVVVGLGLLAVFLMVSARLGGV